MRSFFLFFCLLILTSCGDTGDDKVSKGHRDAIKNECEDVSDIKACGLELRRRFLEDGNEFADLTDRSKKEKKKIKMECFTSKSFGLESYNNCLIEYIDLAEKNELWKRTLPPIAKSHIDDLEQKTVVIQILYQDKTKNLRDGGSGSGVIVKSDLYATNCHVTDGYKDLRDKNYKAAIFVKQINQKKMQKVKLFKQIPERDICLVKKVKDAELSFSTKPVKRIIKFEKLKKGDFVRTFGTPTGDTREKMEGKAEAGMPLSVFEGHTAEGTINYLGTIAETNWKWYDNLFDDTKVVVHSAALNFGSSGGPLFDKNGNLIGINASGDEGGKFNISISAEYILDALD